MIDTPTEKMEAQPKQPSQGCMWLALFAGMVFWALIVSGLAQFASWLMEQVLFEGSLAVADYRWAISLVYAISMLLPIGIVVASLKGFPMGVYWSWLFAALLAVLTIPARMLKISEAQPVALLQIGALILHILVVSRFNPDGVGWKPKNLRNILQPGSAIALLVVGVLAIPWVLWGALGSPLDTLLNLAVGLLFGVSASLTLQLGVFAVPKKPGAADTTHSLGYDGLAAAITLLILATGLGQNGTQWMLSLCLPVLGWAVAAMNRLARSTGEQPAGWWSAPALLIGLAAALPLSWIDPDELMLVISSSPGDLLGWAIRAAWVTFGIGLLASILLAVFLPRLSSASRAARLGFGAAAVAWLAAAGIYVLAGQPGFYGERLFVVFKDQADVSPAQSMTDIDQRRAWVYQTLVQQAQETQSGIWSQFDRFGLSYQPYYLVNALEVQAGPGLRLWLAAQPEVDRVLDSPHLRPLHAGLGTARGVASQPTAPDWNLTNIGADRVWNELQVTGKGVVVGQSDSGVQGNHAELADSYLGRTGSSDYAWFDPWYHSTEPEDFGGHGTHTLGTILGNRTGVAPDADWMGCVNLARNLGNAAYYLDCMQFMLAPFPQGGDPFKDGDPARAADVLNNSWGCPEVEGCDPATFLPAVNALRDAGIFIVVSAGNSGQSGCGSVDAPPAIYDQVYTIGAISAVGDLADFSSRGPVTVDGSRRIKPDLLAPGVDVLSSYPNNTYEIASGTSMAGPHVAGVVALMWSANPALIGDIDQTEAILNETAQPFKGVPPICATGSQPPRDGIGYGVVDAFAAVQQAIAERP